MQRILITGGAGFIGSHLVEHYQQQADTIVLDSLRSNRRHNLCGLEHTFIEGSVTDRMAVDRAMAGVDCVFHLAALTSVPESFEKPVECIGINTLGLLNVLESAAAHGVRKVVLASSSAVYGNLNNQPKVESMAVDPGSPYAVTKLDGEFYLEMFRRQDKLESASLRFFNVFGPRQNPANDYAAVVPKFIQNALANEPIPIHGDGEQTRDFVYVKDVISALDLAANCPDMQGVYNVGSGSSTSINQLARTIIRITGSRSEIFNAPARSGDITHSLASVEKIASRGHVPRHSLEDGLTLTIQTMLAEKNTGEAQNQRGSHVPPICR